MNLNNRSFRTALRTTAYVSIGFLQGFAELSFAQTISDRIAVSDSSNNRVLIFDRFSRENPNASVVLGQADFTHKSPNQGGDPAPNTLQQPAGLAKDSLGNLYVADLGNCRILQFKPPFVSGMSASLIIQDPTNTPKACGLNHPIAAENLIVPISLAFDGSGNLWVADARGSRVLELVPPFSPVLRPNLIFGRVKPRYRSDDLCWAVPEKASASSLCSPTGITFDPEGNLWVADMSDNRVLEFAPPFTPGMAAQLELGQPSESAFTSVQHLLSQCKQCPAPVESDPEESANIFGRKYAPLTSDTLIAPRSVAFDAQGNLWVADQNTARVLKFVPPFSNGMAASMVIGQEDFSHRRNGSNDSLEESARTLTSATDVAFDSNGDLFALDSTESRALIFRPPFRSSMAAVSVLGNLDVADPNLRYSGRYQARVGTAANLLNGPLNIVVF
jgi:hypothetical protein